jgi:hypothetical protein
MRDFQLEAEGGPHRRCELGASIRSQIRRHTKPRHQAGNKASAQSTADIVFVPLTFSFAQLAKGKSLGRSKPANTNVSELGYLFHDSPVCI